MIRYIPFSPPRLPRVGGTGTDDPNFKKNRDNAQPHRLLPGKKVTVGFCEEVPQAFKRQDTKR